MEEKTIFSLFFNSIELKSYKLSFGSGIILEPVWLNDVSKVPSGLNFIKTIRPVSYFRKDDLSKKYLYNALLRKIKFPLQIDTIRIVKSKLVYEEEIDFSKIIKAVKSNRLKIKSLILFDITFSFLK